MSKEDWEKGKGICDCDDSICITVKSDRSLNSHLKGKNQCCTKCDWGR